MTPRESPKTPLPEMGLKLPPARVVQSMLTSDPRAFSLSCSDESPVELWAGVLAAFGPDFCSSTFGPSTVWGAGLAGASGVLSTVGNCALEVITAACAAGASGTATPKRVAIAIAIA